MSYIFALMWLIIGSAAIFDAESTIERAAICFGVAALFIIAGNISHKKGEF